MCAGSAAGHGHMVPHNKSREAALLATIEPCMNLNGAAAVAKVRQWQQVERELQWCTWRRAVAASWLGAEAAITWRGPGAVERWQRADS